MLKKQEAIILKTIDYGEANKIATLYTREAGKLSVLAKGAKKPNSRHAAVMQPFVHAVFVYYQGSGLATVNQGEVIHSFKALHFDVIKSAYASYILELVDKLTEDRKPYVFLFDWLLLALEQIAEGQDPEIIARMFDLKMLSIAGAAPQIDYCANCRSKERDPAVFSILFAGFLCTACAEKDEHAFPITVAFAKLIRVLYYADFKKLGTISVKETTKKQLEQMISAYFNEYIGVLLKSKRFITQLNKLDKNLFRLDNQD